MRIKDLRISNFRNFKDEIRIVPQKINGHDIVVLIGENNAGKSNVLSILHMLFNPERSIRTLEFEETDFYDLNKPIKVEVVLEDLSEELCAEFIGLVDAEQVGGQNKYSLSLKFSVIYDKNTREAEPSLVYARQPDRLVSFGEKKLISFFFQDAMRDYRAIKPNKGSLFGRILNQINLTEQEEAILSKLNEASDSLKNNPEIVEFTNVVADITKQIIDLPRIDDLLRLTIATSTAVDVKKYIQMQLKHHAADKYLDVDQLGLGLQSVLTVSIFRAFAGIGKLREGIFAIDEPESHLYPHAQRKMYREILQLSRTRQVFVATHSPSLIELINPRQICLMRKDAQGTSTSVQLPQNFPEEFVSSYEKHLDVGKADAFFSKAVLLTEGPTEQGLFPELGLSLIYKDSNYDLDRIGVSVINAGGKTNIKAFIRLLNNFGIPCVTVIDYDSKDKNHEKELKEIKEICPNVYELPRKPNMGDIEGYVCDNVPIDKLIMFLEEVLSPERKEDLFSDLKGAIKKADVEKSNELRDMRKNNKSLEEAIPILNEVITHTSEVESKIRETLANSFRKIKGRTTGRLIGEKFSDHFTEKFIENTLDAVIQLAGYWDDIEGEQER
ncbi:ATP-dependent nuclease [Laceyella sacchari]|jgi:putative ATP-dependent endonuclease of the OLD family|uniref:AAA family ATPase n=1 Tax=Laceyella sacchari TaxID=37482 RepID=A0ABY5U738_LACSH|nr:AAA family ATPase [Laceyella sacchari]TCW40771.1 putative ATP-dependent endonuclease of OLD family [Laceyella sacchari]UWE04395.1 AAA family ATPase [Laceyella sacchari]